MDTEIYIVLQKWNNKCTLNRVKGPGNKLRVKTKLETLDDWRTFAMDTLIDCGATYSVIDQGFVRAKSLNTEKLEEPVHLTNADRTENGKMSQYVNLKMTIDDHTETTPFLLANLGKHNLYIGHDWLTCHNPEINWKTGDIKFSHCPMECMVTHAEGLNWKEAKLRLLEDPLPDYVKPFKHLFEQKEFDKLSDRQKWDHAIELTDTEGILAKVYPLHAGEQAQLDEFLDENLKMERIRPSKSPYASPCFFIKKKDGSLRPV